MMNDEAVVWYLVLTKPKILYKQKFIAAESFVFGPHEAIISTASRTTRACKQIVVSRTWRSRVRFAHCIHEKLTFHSTHREPTNPSGKAKHNAYIYKCVVTAHHINYTILTFPHKYKTRPTQCYQRSLRNFSISHHNHCVYQWLSLPIYTIYTYMINKSVFFFMYNFLWYVDDML